MGFGDRRSGFGARWGRGLRGAASGAERRMGFCAFLALIDSSAFVLIKGHDPGPVSGAPIFPYVRCLYISSRGPKDKKAIRADSHA